MFIPISETRGGLGGMGQTYVYTVNTADCRRIVVSVIISIRPWRHLDAELKDLQYVRNEHRLYLE